MPQSMMSDRQANSLGGQTLLPHFQTLGMPGIMWLWKGIWVHILVGGSHLQGLSLMVKNPNDGGG